MPRATKPWVGKTDDSKAPPRVCQRAFDRAGGVCHFCKQPIKIPGETWQTDHVIALINGGENREANLAPIHSHCHLKKTGLDLADKKKVAKVRQKHIGIVAESRPIESPGFRTSKHRVKREARAKDALPPLPPRSLFTRQESPT